MNRINKLTFSIILIFPFLLSGQNHILFSSDYGYWQHTDLNGMHFGTGYERQIAKLRINALLKIGYGEKNQYKNNDEIDLSLLSVLEIASPLNSSLNEKERRHTRFKPVTDYSKEISLTLGINYDLYSVKKVDYFIGTGIFISDVFQFQVLDIRQGYEMDFSIFNGPVNLFIVSNQRFLTCGLIGKIGIRLRRGKNNFTFEINGGLGPKKTSYFGLGFSAGGLISQIK